MHELSIVQSIVENADRFAKSHGIVHAEQITVMVGAMTGVIPRYMHMYYPELTTGTALEGSELVVELVPAEAFCKDCGEVFDPTKLPGDCREKHKADNLSNPVCPACGSGSYELLHGNEMTIKEMAFKDDNAPAMA